MYSRDSKRNSCEVHDGCFSSLQSTNEQQGGKIKNIKYADVESGIRYEVCPNQGSIAILQAQFGKLFRTGVLGGNARTIAETLSETCRLVHAHHFPTQDCYSRVFVWEDEDQMVFLLGNSPEKHQKDQQKMMSWYGLWRMEMYINILRSLNSLASCVSDSSVSSL
ncbi:hypothetical protein C1646_746320 [Rhizophagus diaphanus]|nr:hypothetical protein C1646_746320 [Rhizophagus diaphanus] [Rhizophagus sp. MUCL 43196]